MDYSNVGASLAQVKGQTAYVEQNTAAVSGKQQGIENLLRNLEPGQIFTGEITDIRGTYLTIALQNMQTVNARLAENFEFLIGQKALFQVKDNQDNQLLIRPLATSAAQNGEWMMAERALRAAGIQITEKNLELVKNLMAANQPIDKQSILSYVRQSARFPQAEITDIINLHKYQIPVTEETLNQLSNYHQFEHSLLKDIDTLQQELPQMIKQMSAESPELAESFVKSFLDIFSAETTKQAETVSQTVTEETPVEGRAAVPIRNTEGNVPEKVQNAEGKEIHLASQNSEVSDSLKFPLLPDGKEWIEKTEVLIKRTLEQHLLLKPEDVANKEKVKEYYKETDRKTQSLKELAASYGKAAVAWEKPVQNMSQNLKFMQAINEMYTYIQLPLKMHKEKAHGDLYVYTRRKAKGNAEEGVSAMLHLDMEHLGAVDVLVRLHGQRVATNFTLETEELLDFVEQHMELLTQRLKEKGYDCSVQAAVKNQEEQKQSFEQLLTGEEESYSDIKRFSFDVRA